MIKYHEDKDGNLADEKGNIIVPVEKRQKTEVFRRSCTIAFIIISGQGKI